MHNTKHELYMFKVLNFMPEYKCIINTNIEQVIKCRQHGWEQDTIIQQ